MEDLESNPTFLLGEGDHIWNVSTTTISTFLPLNNTTRPYWKTVLETATTVITTFNLILLMTGMGSATYLREIWLNLKKPWGSLIGMVCQFGILPAVGFGLALVLELPHYQALGLLILCCSPGGAFSNFFAYWLEGDIALSLLMTATSSLLAFGGMPLNMWLYSHHWIKNKIKIPYTNILISMAFATGPALLGMFIRHRTRIWATRIIKICSVLGWIGAITSGLFVVIIYWESFLTVTWSLGLAAAAVPFVGFGLAFLISKIFCLNNSICRTIGIETGCQNIVVAMNVMLLSFPDPEIRSEMILFPMVYGLAQLLEVLLFIMVFQCYKFAHRYDVTEEIVKSVIDDTVLMKVPNPRDVRTNESEEMKTNPDVIYSNGQLMRGDGENVSNSLSDECEDTVPLRIERHSVSLRDESEDGTQANPLLKAPHPERICGQVMEDERIELFSDHRIGFSVSSPLMLDKNRKMMLEEQHNSLKSDVTLDLSVLPLCASCQQPISKVEIVKNIRGGTKTKQFLGDIVRDSPPRSPSMNAGYGFPTFREKNGYKQPAAS